MYQGQLITFKIKDKSSLLSISLLDINLELDNKGLLLKRKQDESILGYVIDVYGINISELMSIFGYEEEEKSV